MLLTLFFLLSCVAFSSGVKAAACEDDEHVINIPGASSKDKDQSGKWTHFFGNARIEEHKVGAGKPSAFAHRFFYLEHKKQYHDNTWRSLNDRLSKLGSLPGFLACGFGYVSIAKKYASQLDEIVAYLKKNAKQIVEDEDEEAALGEVLRNGRKKIFETYNRDLHLFNALKYLRVSSFFAHMSFDDYRVASYSECEADCLGSCRVKKQHNANVTCEMRSCAIGPYERTRVEQYYREILNPEVDKDISEWTFVVGPHETEQMEDAFEMPFDCDNHIIVESLKLDKQVPRNTPVVIVNFNKANIGLNEWTYKRSGLDCEY